jgi:hypothetical protein
VIAVFLLTCGIFLLMVGGLVWKLGWALFSGPIGYAVSLVSVALSRLTPRR